MNHLSMEKSPYLRQHMHNPVDWYPWSEEAFAKADRENKPVFLSIGYASCHWCHVMAHESFEDEEVARLLNESFVCIKVDREERPDIDALYMKTCQIITGRGGWPLSIFLTPNKKPFFADTYIPKHSRFGRTGFIELIHEIRNIWHTKQADIAAHADQVTRALQQISTNYQTGSISLSLWDTAFQHLAAEYDPEHGGFGPAPRFPMPHNISFLLKYWKLNGNKHALEMSEKTLQKMRNGGIFDQIGYGFHRYSTDTEWHLPHFEKMLPDQALLCMVYLEAFQATHKRLYARIAEEILMYVQQNLFNGNAFYASEDADTDDEEGIHYVWTQTELKDILTEQEFEVARELFGITQKGNYFAESTGLSDGHNILDIEKDLTSVAEKLDISQSDIGYVYSSLKSKLYTARLQRPHPGIDNKVLTDWNGYMIAAFALAGRTLNVKAYTEVAERCLRFLEKNLTDDQAGLTHCFCDGKKTVTGQASDYAAIVWALLELYESTWDTRYLSKAITYNDYLLDHFWDNEGYGFYMTEHQETVLQIRQKEYYDGAAPSENSIALTNLLRLGHLTGDTRFYERASELSSVYGPLIAQSPTAYLFALGALGFMLGPSFEIVLAGRKESLEKSEMLSILRTRYIPFKVTLVISEDHEAEIHSVASYTAGYRVTEPPVAYVCRNNTCLQPITDSADLLRALEPA